MPLTTNYQGEADDSDEMGDEEWGPAEDGSNVSEESESDEEEYNSGGSDVTGMYIGPWNS